MSFQAEEAAHAAAIQTWWKRHGQWVMALVMMILAAASVVQWHLYQTKQRQHESALRYERWETQHPLSLWHEAQHKDPHGSYTALMTLYQAAQWQHTHRDQAIQALRTLIDHKPHALLLDLAKLQLAGLFCQHREDVTKGLEVLNTLSHPSVARSIQQANCQIWNQPGQAQEILSQVATRLKREEDPQLMDILRLRRGLEVSS